jgi:DNA repair protein RecN (Recombination protein N)
LRERKALLTTLKRKYGATLDEVRVLAEAASARRDQLTGADGRIATIDADVERAREAVEEIARELTTRRRDAADILTKMVNEELPALALPKAVFEVACDDADHTENGADRITFLFSSDPERSKQEIGKIASGGELSRAMIAVTLALAQTHDVPVLIFDEADQGVGGEAALELARRLQRLGRSHQVLVVSHLPQLAAFADRHLVVRRTSAAVGIAAVDGDERLTELSRMLAGLGSSDLARAHAAELLQLADRERSDADG